MIDFNSTPKEIFLKLIQDPKAWLLIVAALSTSIFHLSSDAAEIIAGLAAAWVVIILWLRK